MDAEAQKEVARLHKAAETGEQIAFSLDTDDRVLARVTDGIYRQPASAIRELIANAYDADATVVTVLTDAPRYSEILVRDNGNGMTAKVLLNMIHHIGGSAKRTPVGQELEVTHPDDPKLSPGGRRLIGKIGIGVFSVSQLTRQFTIITKPKKEKFRYTAVVTLHRYTDDELADARPSTTFKSGDTVVRVEAVDDDVGHGTTILLGELMQRAKEMLQSRDMWAALRKAHDDDPGVVRRIEPAVHSGLLGADGVAFEVEPKVPWEPKVDADKRMKMLSDRLLEAAKGNELYTQLEHAFDYYYRMVWSLGLALPARYLISHPYDLPGELPVKCFLLSNKTRAAAGSPGEDQAKELPTGPKKSVGVAAKLEEKEVDDFRVDIDGLMLFRPIRFDTQPGTNRALQTPLLFVGGYKPDLRKFSKTQRGGQDLAFTGYFFWTPRVIPKEHIGLLVRINGASGTLFDTTFLNYQIAERTRLKQVVAEVFVSQGLEEALNIDRESFNTAHPHYQILLNWVHNALRQVFTKQKALESTARGARRAAEAETERSAVQKAMVEELQRAVGEEEDAVADVCFTDDEDEQERAEEAGKRVFSKINVVERPALGGAKAGSRTDSKIDINEQRAAAVARLLDAYGLLDHLGPDEQSQLLAAIVRIFNVG
jgi:hypothetical protein